MAEPLLGKAAEGYVKRTTHSQRCESRRLKAVTTREQRRRERQGLDRMYRLTRQENDDD